ncbi:LANO_0C06106g1_1 [Lachancea nothofagi CBS 11611]|uniref:LANO_0C06106g1_1 n=1 Tax=Lachancea nothofagi CBS 11611 TaxID=1266666 RepID=A0A1G4J8G3_9SACH|nr:LANO_0C06106g1_1 [Lachancea nothofagi CBS 11611]
MSHASRHRTRFALPHDENASVRAETYAGKTPLLKRSSYHKDTRKKPDFELQALHPNASVVRSAIDSDLQSLVAYMRQPEPLHTRERFSIRDWDPSVRIVRPTTLSQMSKTLEPEAFVPILLRNDELLPYGNLLDLSPISKETPTNMNYPPIFHEHEDARPLDPDDYEGICLAALQDEFSRIIDGHPPIFERQLELKEKSSQLSWLDYSLYYILGYDKTGYFSLLQELNEFRDRPWARFVQPTETMDSEGDSSTEGISEVTEEH